MKRPSFQFYPADWQANSNLRRCSHEEKGIWLDVLCLLHDQEPYGLVRWSLKEIAQAVGTTLPKLRGIVSKGVLKGADPGSKTEALVFVPRHGRRDGEPVTLLAVQAGPLWFSSRMVIDEYKRVVRGEASGAPDYSPKGGIGEGIGEAPKVTPNPSPHPSPSRARPSSSSSTSSSVNTPVGVFTTQRGDGKHPMPEDWQPSEDTYKLLSARLVDRTFSEQAVPEFMLYWRGRPDRDYAGGWDQKFLQSTIRQWEKYRHAVESDNTPRAIPQNFMPTDETMQSLREAGIPDDLILGSLDQFKRYWTERNEIHGSWNAKFHTWALGDYARHQQGQGLGMAEKLQDRSWADGVIHDSAH